MITLSLIIACIGLAISIYGIMVERNLQQNAEYKPTCDINDRISCSRPMLSEYNKMLGISNIWASALYYCVMIILILFNAQTPALLLACAGVITSVIFGYILYFKIKSFCLICTSLYIVNGALAYALFF